jgi:carboxyvinyl-carboxyphosphonate phosphorylmutase
MTAETARARYRAILKGERCINPGSVFDPLSARIAHEVGFDAMMLAGSVASLAVLGAPDIILLTLPEFAGLARRICRAVPDLPLMCDADHGYGNALNVMRTVEELESAGVAGLTIEDTDLPRGYGKPPASLLSVAEGLGKMRAAVKGRSDPQLSVLARTSALNVVGLDEALARLRAYQDSGVDGMFFTGAKKKSEVEALAKVARIPLLLGGAGPELADKEFLAAHGVRVALLGHQSFMASVAAVHKTLSAQKNGGALAETASNEMMSRLMRDADYRALAKDFLGGE